MHECIVNSATLIRHLHTYRKKCVHTVWGKISRQETPNSVREVYRCTGRESRDLDALGSRELIVIVSVSEIENERVRV